MKIVLPFYKIAYAVSFVVILSVIRAVVFAYEIGRSREPPFAILTAVFCADTYVQEITSNRSEVQRLYQIKKRIYSIIQRLMIQGTFLLLLAVLGYGLFFAFQKPITHPVTESEILQFITCFGAIVVTIFFWGILANTLSMLFRNMWMGIGSSLLIWVATNSTGGDKLFGAWNLFSYSFRDIENTADFTWLYGKGVCICIGLFLNLLAKSVFTHHLNFEELRYLGVMQRLAIGYGVTSLVAITVKHKYFPAIILVTLAVYFLLLAMGDGFNLSATNIVARFDVWALGTSHMYHDGGMAFDPEGLLSTLPAVCHVMVGFYCGKLLFSAKDNDEKIQRLFLVGTILTFAGFLLSYGCPINKKVWSPTFVITTCGLASSFLALLIWIIDIKGYQGWCVFFRSFGVNPLFIYVFAEIMGILLGATGASVFIYEKVLVPVLGNYPGSLAYALLYVLFCWSIVHILYKKGIYVKI